MQRVFTYKGTSQGLAAQFKASQPTNNLKSYAVEMLAGVSMLFLLYMIACL